MDTIHIPQKPRWLTSHCSRSAYSASRPKPTRTTNRQARTSACAARSARRDGAATPTSYLMSSSSTQITRRSCSRRHQQSLGPLALRGNSSFQHVLLAGVGCSLQLPILLCRPRARAKIISLDSVVKRSLGKSMNQLTDEVEAAVAAALPSS